MKDEPLADPADRLGIDICPVRYPNVCIKMRGSFLRGCVSLNFDVLALHSGQSKIIPSGNLLAV